MVPFRKVLILAALAGLMSCKEAPQQAGAPAEKPTPAAPAAKAEGNPRFYTVQEQLDPGGSVYVYVDTKDVARTFIDGLKQLVPQLGMPPQGAGIATAVIDEIGRTGLYDVQDLGFSTYPEGALNRSKLFIHTPDGRTGLLKLLGGPAHRIEMLDYAPADTQLFTTFDFDLPQLLGYVRETVQNVGGQAAVGNLDQQMAMASQQLGTDVAALLNSLTGPFALIGSLDPTQKLTMATGVGATPAQMDAPRVVLIVGTNSPALYDLLKAKLTEAGLAQPETTQGELKQFAVSAPPNETWAVEPVVASDGGHLYVASHAAYLSKLLAAKKAGGGLNKSEEFARMSAGLPTEGNSMTFVSEKLMQAYQGMMKSVLEQDRGEMAALQKYLQEQLGVRSGSYSIGVNRQDGIQVVARSDQGGKAILAAAVAAPVAILAAIAVPNFLEAQTRSKVSRVRSDQRSLATAIEAYYIDNNTYVPSGETWRLTTPIAYVTREFSDPFQKGGEVFSYFSNALGWIMWSVGPDGVPDLTPGNIGQVYNPASVMPSPALLQMTFDPTNGTISPGDLWRVKQ